MPRNHSVPKLWASSLLFFLATSACMLHAQLAVTPSANAAALVNQLIGPGITVSNVTLNTQPNAAGTFTATGTNLGLTSGVLLTSGEVANAVGPNLNPGITTAHNSPGDPQLNALTAPFLTEDACVLEFDMVASCDSIQISYVFGSDEYDEWVCSDYTDAFAFFISGPGIAGTQNIALIPGSATPVAVNTVNIGAVGTNAFPPYPTNCNTGNSAYFVTNNTGATVEYDGFTVPLVAKAAVMPCSTYHIKLVVADAGDASLDSGVFLEQNGIRCTSSSISVTSSIPNPGYQNAVEGCVPGRFTFTRSGDTTQAVTFNYTVAGTATPLFDYPVLPGSVTFPANVSTVSLMIFATQDGLVEGNESVTIILSDTVCGTVFADSATLYIQDQITVSAGPSVTLCQGDTVPIGQPPLPGFTYLWLPGSSLSSNTVSNPLFHNPVPGSYLLTLIGTDSVGCQGGDTMTVQVLLSATADFVVDTTACEREPITVTYTGTAPPTATFNWSFPGAQVLSGSGMGPYLIRYATNGPKTISLVVGQGMCASLPVVQTVTVYPTPTLTLHPVDLDCYQDFSGSITCTVAQANPPMTFSWSNGASTPGISGLPAGTYTLIVNNYQGCADTATATLTEPPLLTNVLDTTAIVCNGGTGTISNLTAGGTPPYSYNWSNSLTGPGITVGAGLYAVTVTDANGCTALSQVELVEPPLIALTITGDDEYCEYDPLTLTAVVGGGVPPFTYTWSSLPVGVTGSAAVLSLDSAMDGVYAVQITDQNGCVSHATFDADVYFRPMVAFGTDISRACDSATVTFLNQSLPAGSTYLWTFPDGTQSALENPAHWFGTGLWGASLTVTSPQGCVNDWTSPALVEILPTPVASFVTDPAIHTVDYLLLSDATIDFINTSPFFAQSIVWDFGNGDSAFVGQVLYTYPQSGTYTITMTAYNAFGCHDDTSQTLVIWDDPALWIPNAFTPNGDPLNDRFTVQGKEVERFHIDIYDRWGKLIFRSDDIAQGWDGRIDGEMAAEGVYVYVVEAVLNTGPVRRTGSVTLIR